jgi:hypothetical protein
MTTAATRNRQDNTPEVTLFVASELSEKTWKLGFTTGHGQKPRERPMAARQQERVLDEIARVKRRLVLPETASVVSCPAPRGRRNPIVQPGLVAALEASAPWLIRRVPAACPGLPGGEKGWLITTAPDHIPMW